MSFFGAYVWFCISLFFHPVFYLSSPFPYLLSVVWIRGWCAIFCPILVPLVGGVYRAFGSTFLFSCVGISILLLSSLFSLSGRCFGMQVMYLGVFGESRKCVIPGVSVCVCETW